MFNYRSLLAVPRDSVVIVAINRYYNVSYFKSLFYCDSHAHVWLPLHLLSSAPPRRSGYSRGSRRAGGFDPSN